MKLSDWEAAAAGLPGGHLARIGRHGTRWCWAGSWSIVNNTAPMQISCMCHSGSTYSETCKVVAMMDVLLVCTE